MTCFDKAAGGFAYSSLILSVIDPLAGSRFSVHIRRGLIAAFQICFTCLELTRVGVKYYGIALFWMLIGKLNYDITQIVHF